MARLRRPFAANKSVAVVDAGVKADAAEATNRGAKDWKRILKSLASRLLEMVNAGVAQYLNLAIPWSRWSIDKVSQTDIAFHALAAWVLDVDILGNQ
jgi:hypothetical protein